MEIRYEDKQIIWLRSEDGNQQVVIDGKFITVNAWGEFGNREAVVDKNGKIVVDGKEIRR